MMGSLVLTDDHCSYRRLVEDPPSGDVRDAHPTMTISNQSQDREEFLEEGPIAPRLQYHIKVLEGGGCRDDRIGELSRFVGLK